MGRRTTVLAWVEDGLPGDGPEARRSLALRLDLRLEVANRPEVHVPPELRARVVTLQADGMHAWHPLHPDAEVRARGQAHLRETIDRAARWGVPRVLAVCGYGSDLCAHPFASCLGFFGRAVGEARSHGVRLMIEPLSPLRAAAMTDPGDVARLLDALAAPATLGVAIDTGHLLDAGRDPLEVLSDWRRPVEELQLRGAGSAPPAEDVPLARWLDALPEPPAVVCVEHRTPIDEAGVERLVTHLRSELEAAGLDG